MMLRQQYVKIRLLTALIILKSEPRMIIQLCSIIQGSVQAALQCLNGTTFFPIVIKSSVLILKAVKSANSATLKKQGENQMKKYIFGLLATIIAITSVSGLIAFAADNNDNKDKIIVEVIVNEYGDDAIKDIELDDGTHIGDYEYEIIHTTKLTRDPAYIANYFKQAIWITRNDVISLSLIPHDTVRNSKSEKDKAWTILSGTATGLGGHKNWPILSQKVKTFKWQYDCHFYFANSKAEWNIEPSRSANSYAAVVAKKCNP